jgi:hypothetical protein
MARAAGTLSEGDKVLVQKVAINLRPTPGSTGLEGEFVVPSGSPYLCPGNSYDLKLSDGRSGQILVKQAHVGSDRPTRIEFVTKGPFV